MSTKISRRAVLSGGAALVGAALPLWKTAAGVLCQSNCFTKADNSRLGGLRVFRLALPPANDTVDSTYAYWPCTDASTAGNFPSSTWSGNKWHYIWANRGMGGWNWKPNGVNPAIFTSSGIVAGTQFSSIDKANAVTQSQIRYSLGWANYADPWINVGGSASDFIPWATLAADPDTYFTQYVTNGVQEFMVMVDRPWLTAYRLVNAHAPALGFTLDYEVTDSRTTSQATTFIQNIANDIHASGKQLFVLTDPLNSGVEIKSGFDNTNLPSLHRNYIDILQITMWSGNPEGDVLRSYANQIAVLKGPSGTEVVNYDRLAINFILGGSTTTDAATTHGVLTDPTNPHPTKLILVPNGATMGGACGSTTNDEISYVCFGTPS